MLAGVVRLLDNLAERDHVRLGLLTGNLRTAARIKLEHYGLHGRFAFGGFGDHHENRNDVAREAVEAAECDRSDSRFWVIGDTPLDVSCARAIGASVVAVATGLHLREELATHKPDLLLDDLSDGERILETLLG